MGLFVGVFARWVAGVWCLRYCCVRLLVFALSGCWRACLGWWGSVVPPPLFLPGLLACLRSGVGLLACAMLLWVRGNGNGAGQSCPAPYAVGVAVRRPMRARGRREGLGGEGALMVC